MFDESSPEVRAALRPYEDILAQHNARMAGVGEEFARDLAVADKAAAERDKEQAQQLSEILDREKQQQNGTAEPQQQNQWTAPREKETTISFGDYDDEERADKSTWSAPTPPMGLPSLPPIPDPVPAPEPPRAVTPEPMMRFGDFDDETPAPPAPSAPLPLPPPPPRPGGRRRLQDDDDEDMSGRTWLS